MKPFILKVKNKLSKQNTTIVANTEENKVSGFMSITKQIAPSQFGFAIFKLNKENFEQVKKEVINAKTRKTR